MKLPDLHRTGRVALLTAVSSMLTLGVGVLVDDEALEAAFSISRSDAITILVLTLIALFLVGCLLTAVGVLVDAYAQFHKADASEKMVRRHHCVPNAVTLHSRTETFSFDDDANCTMECRLDVEVADQLSFLDFPFYAEYSGPSDSDSLMEKSRGVVSVQNATVDGNPQGNVMFKPVEIRSPVDPAAGVRDSLLYGTIQLPLPTEGGKRRFQVFMRIHLTGVFPSLREREYILIEIPYYTEQISVRVECAKRNRTLRRVVLQSSGQVPHLVANLGTGHVRDHHETTKQLHNVNSNNHSIGWQTVEPLLGHRYFLYFKAQELVK